MGLRIDTLSRFLQTESVIKDDKATFGLWVRPDFLKRSDLQEEEILTINIDQNRAGRPDQIANEFYGTALLEWVVIMFNRPLDPTNWPKAGDVIQIPTNNAVKRGL